MWPPVDGQQRPMMHFDFPGRRPRLRDRRGSRARSLGRYLPAAGQCPGALRPGRPPLLPLPRRRLITRPLIGRSGSSTCLRSTALAWHLRHPVGRLPVATSLADSSHRVRGPGGRCRDRGRVLSEHWRVTSLREPRTSADVSLSSMVYTEYRQLRTLVQLPAQLQLCPGALPLSRYGPQIVLIGVTAAALPRKLVMPNPSSIVRSRL